MCGIFALICFPGSGTTQSSASSQLSANGLSRLKRRGPDAFRFVSADSTGDMPCVLCWSSVLHIRGGLTPQPVTDAASGSILMFNGELYNGFGLPETFDQDIVEASESNSIASENDTAALWQVIQKRSNWIEVCCLVTILTGPFSFVFVQKSHKSVWFCRDVFGRRSLLWTVCADGLILSSVKADLNGVSAAEFFELPAGILFELKSAQAELSSISSFRLVAHWLVPPSTATMEQFDRFLAHSRLSGHHFLLSHKLDFASNASNRLPQLFKMSRLIDVRVNLPCHVEPSMTMDYYLSRNRDTVASFVDHLAAAVDRRTRGTVPKVCANCKLGADMTPDGGDTCRHAKIAVLFSGGVDSTILAALAHRFVPPDEPIDLFNVAFENTDRSQIASRPNAKRISRSSVPSQEKVAFDVPDRRTGLTALAELRSLCPGRRWNFLKIDVPLAELKQLRAERIADLVSPQRTVLDDSIGCAMWFAARGVGQLLEEDSGLAKIQYVSPAPIVLLGTGADELLGGYSRHRVRFTESGADGLLTELEMELSRLAYRNLGRDDRVIADHGRESRLPFLDETFVRYVNGLALHEKLDFSLPRGIGEKLLLRLALWDLGFRHTALNEKRAMQFGSRIAKLEGPRENAMDVCARLAAVALPLD